MERVYTLTSTKRKLKNTRRRITVTQLLECGVAESGGGGFSYALTRIVLTAPHMFIVTLLIILYLIINRIIMPIFGTIILGALPCFALCCKHYEEDTQLTVQEAVDQGQMQGAKSYDITSNRAYAAMFGLDEDEHNKVHLFLRHKNQLK